MRLSILTTLAYVLLALSGNHDIRDITDNCLFKDHKFISYCYVRDVKKSNEMIFRDSISFEAFGKETFSPSSYCQVPRLPLIDFSKFTLLAKYNSSGDCKSKYERKLLLDETNKRLKYIVEVTYHGSCEKIISSWNYVLVPKISDDYTIDIELVEKRTFRDGHKPSPRMDSLLTESMELDTKIRLLQKSLDSISQEIRFLRKKNEK